MSPNFVTVSHIFCYFRFFGTAPIRVLGYHIIRISQPHTAPFVATPLSQTHSFNPTFYESVIFKLGKAACNSTMKPKNNDCKVCNQFTGEWEFLEHVSHMVDDNCTHSELLYLLKLSCFFVFLSVRLLNLGFTSPAVFFGD